MKGKDLKKKEKKKAKEFEDKINFLKAFQFSPLSQNEPEEDTYKKFIKYLEELRKANIIKRRERKTLQRSESTMDFYRKNPFFQKHGYPRRIRKKRKPKKRFFGLKTTSDDWTSRDARFLNGSEKLVSDVLLILNKITPEKYDVLKNEFCELKIVNSLHLKLVIDKLFEVVVDFPEFSDIYSQLCFDLFRTEKFVNNYLLDNEVINANDQEKEEKMEEKEKSRLKSKIFKAVLLNKCQIVFYESIKDLFISEEEKTKDNKKENDETKKTRTLEEIKAAKTKSIGNIMFIASLYKQEMLKISIMTEIITKLLHFAFGTISEPTEKITKELNIQFRKKIKIDKTLNPSKYEHIFLAMKLLSKVGKEMESTPGYQKIVAYYINVFKIIQSFEKISSRVKIKCQEIVELKTKRQWKPLVQEKSAKKLNELEKEYIKENKVLMGKSYKQRERERREHYERISRGRNGYSRNSPYKIRREKEKKFKLQTQIKEIPKILQPQKIKKLKEITKIQGQKEKEKSLPRPQTLPKKNIRGFAYHYESFCEDGDLDSFFEDLSKENFMEKEKKKKWFK